MFRSLHLSPSSSNGFTPRIYIEDLLTQFPHLRKLCYNEDIMINKQQDSLDLDASIHTTLDLPSLQHPIRCFESSSPLKAGQIIWFLHNCPSLRRIKVCDIEIDSSFLTWRFDCPSNLSLLHERRKRTLRVLSLTCSSSFSHSRYELIADLFPRLRSLSINFKCENSDDKAKAQETFSDLASRLSCVKNLFCLVSS